MFFRTKKVFCHPSTLEGDLIDWASTHHHESSSLLMKPEVIRFVELLALTSYKDSRFIGIMKNHVIIGSYELFNKQNHVVLDLIYETYPEHRLVYNRTTQKISPILGIYIAQIDKK